MSEKVVTPPSRKNTDWYRVQYRLASNLVNDAYVSKGSFEAGAAETDALLKVIWRMLAPGWGVSWAKDAPLRRFLRQTAEPATLSLKAIADLGLRDFNPGDAQGLDLNSVRRMLRADETVSPQAIVDALMREKRERKPSLCFDFACFFMLSGDNERAREYAEEGLRKVPPDRQARLRARIAADPMLGAIPGLGLIPETAREGGRCGFLKRRPKQADRLPARPWI